MSRDFTDWESTLMHYGVPGMRKGHHKVLNPALGTYQQDKQFIKDHNINTKSEDRHFKNVSREDSLKKMLKNSAPNPQDIINKRRRKLLKK